MPRGHSRNLTPLMIDKLPKAPAGKRAEHFDRQAPGLCLRVTDKGSKSWSVYYRLNGKNQRLTLSHIPAVDVKQARVAAHKVKDQAKAGVDPRTARDFERRQQESEARAQAETLKSFRTIAEQYKTRECPKLARGEETKRALDERLLPKLGDLPISEIRKRDVYRITEILLDEGKPAAAHFVFEIARRIYRWAHERDEIEANPLAGMKPPVKLEHRDRTLTNDELKLLWKALGTEQIGFPFGPLQKLLLVTAQRRNEVAQMRWSEVDLDKAEWTIPKARSKSARAHLVPLSELAVEVLSELPRFHGGDFVFTTSAGRRPVSGFSKAKSRIDELTEVTDWRWHDLRRTARTHMARLGVPDVVAERVLGHGPKGLAAVYNLHQYADEKRDALERWARELTVIIAPPPNNGVELGAGA